VAGVVRDRDRGVRLKRVCVRDPFGQGNCRQRCLRVGRLLAMSTTIRVSEETRDRLASLANATGRPMTKVLEDAVETLERRIFFETLNQRYQELRDDPEAWAEIDHERGTEEDAVGDTST